MTAAPTPTPTDPIQAVHRLAGELGFALVGIAPAEPSDYEAFVRQWLAEGRHGEMDYLARQVDQRLDPRVLVPGARAVICVADRYACRYDGLADDQDDVGPAVGRIARYAWGDDYHRVMKKRLFALADAMRAIWPRHEFRTAVDTAPVMEREHARRAGLGWIGKHTLLINTEVGSWLLLGEIVTTLPLAPAAPQPQPSGPAQAPSTDHCGTCTRCIDACPTGCISPYQLDARRCISYLTIEHRGPIDPALHAAMGDWIAGCDVCQQVCPFNGASDEGAAASTQASRAAPGADGRPPIHRRYTPRPPAPALPLLDVLGWSPDDRRRAFARSALKRIKLDALKRNALIAAGNALARRDDPALRRRIEQLARDGDEPELVRHTARQVLDRLARD